LRDVDLLARHLGRNILEQRRAQIALAGVRQHAQHFRALLGARTDLQGAGERGAASDAGEDA
jgi:hypothetical protein